MKRAFVFSIILIASIPVLLASGQVDSIVDSLKHIDSLNQKLIEFTDQIKANEQQRMADSIRKMDLRRELELVTASDYLQRQELQERITQLEQKDSIRREETRHRAEAIRSSNAGFPVVPFGDTILWIYAKIGAYTPAERAGAITQKIQQLYKRRPYYPDSLFIVDAGFTKDLIYRGVIIMSVTDLDALIKGVDANVLVIQYRKTINQALLDHIKNTSLLNILKRVGLVLLVIGVVALLIFLIIRLFRFTKKYIETHLAKFLRGYKIRNYEFISKEKLLKAILWLNTIIKYFLFVLVIYMALPSLFSIFPVTESWADTLLGWIIHPVLTILKAFVNYLPNLITIIIVVVVVIYIVKFLKYFAREIQLGKLAIRGFHPDYAMPTFGIVRFLFYAFMFVIIFPYLPGSDSDIFKGVSVFLGVLVSLGSSSAISNVVAGLVITYMRPFKIGDRIKIGDVTGDVIEKTPLVIRLRTIKNEEITIPNSQILTSHTVNFTASGKNLGLILHTTVTIGYDAPWKQVHELLITAATSTKGILSEPRPFVLQTSLDDFYVSYEINAYTKSPENAAMIYSDLHRNIQDKFNEAGVEIMSPHYEALRDGNQIAIPPENLPKDYSPSGFRIHDNLEK